MSYRHILTVFSVVSLFMMCATVAHAGFIIFTNQSEISSSTVIDFEQNGSGNTLPAINTFLAPKHATFSYSNTGNSEIADLPEFVARTVAYGVQPGAGGNPIGLYALRGGELDVTSGDLTFGVGFRPHAVGLVWGGLGKGNGNPYVNMSVTLQDGTFFKIDPLVYIPAVENDANLSNANNGFLGILSTGSPIASFHFQDGHDLVMEDNITFGEHSSATPEPTSIIIYTLGIICIAVRKMTNYVLSRNRESLVY